MHSVGRICVQCCNVFSKVCICTVNVVLSLSTLLSSVAVSHSEGSVCGQIGAMLRVVCFVGRVLDALRGRKYKNAERQWVSVTSSRGVRECRLKVLWLFCEVTEGRVFLLRCL